jgi:hypothetical protein
MSRTRPALLEEVRQSWRMVLIVAIVSCLLGVTTGFGYVQLRFVGVMGSPSETVQRYLLAISQSDSVAAMQELAARPADSSMLTDETLRAAHLDSPMSALHVTQTRSPRVPVSFVLGTTKVETVITVTAVNGTFRIDQGLATADLTQTRALGVAVQLGGRDVSADTVPVFPGIYPLSTTDNRLSLKPGGFVKATDVGETASPPEQALDLTDAGMAALRTAAQTQVTACAASISLAPPDCPFSADPRSTYRENTAKWTSLVEPDVVAVVEGATAKVTVTGRLRLSAVVAATGKPATQTVSYDSLGKVDLRAATWRIAWE